MNKKKYTCNALTLPEILAVLVILGAIMSTLYVSFGMQADRGKRNIAQMGIQRLVNEVDIYRAERGMLPKRLEELTEAGMIGKKKLLDPWRNPYVYMTPGRNGDSFELVSYGKDGLAGGEGADADISSSEENE